MTYSFLWQAFSAIQATPRQSSTTMARRKKKESQTKYLNKKKVSPQRYLAVKYRTACEIPFSCPKTRNFLRSSEREKL